MPRRNQGNPLVIIFLFLFPFILASFLKMQRLERNSRRQPPAPVVKKNNTKAPPKKDFLVMEEWNTIIPPPKNDLLLTPEPNKSHWYAFIIQP